MMTALFLAVPLALTAGARSVSPAQRPASPGAADGRDAVDGAESILRTYDLSHLNWSEVDEGDRLAISLAPGLTFPDAELDDESEDAGRSAGDRVMVLLQALLGDEFQYEGRRFMETGAGQLLVVGPPALHQRVALVLGYLDRLTQAHVEFAVDVWTLPAGAGVPAIGSIVPGEDADRWAEGLGQRGATRARYSMQARAGRAALLKATRDVQAILDYDVEIAQGATITNPIFGTAAIGTRFALRAAPSSGGVHLAFTWRNTDLLEGTGRDVKLGFMVGTGQGQPGIYENPLYLSDMRVMSRAASVATHLPTGHALILEMGADLKRAGIHEYLVVRQVSGGFPVIEGLSLGAADEELFFAHIGALLPPTCVHHGGLMGPSKVAELVQPGLKDVSLLAAGLRRPQDSPLLGFLAGVAGRSVSVDVQGDWITAFSIPSANGDPRKLRLLRQRIEDLQAPVETLDVRVQLDQAGTPVVVSQVPVRIGTSCGVAIGIDDFEQPDYDVEVAQFAATEDPQIVRGIDGLVLFMEPVVSLDGSLSLVVRGSGHLLLERDTIDLGGTISARVDRSQYAHLFVNQTVSLAPNGDGRWSAVLGFQGEGASSSDLALRLEITR